MKANGTDTVSNESTEGAGDEQIDVLRWDGRPAHFIWRGRLYRVREVVAHWIQVGADSGELPSVLLRADRARGTVETLVFGRDREVERELWTVRASVGRSGDVEVFQLCHDLTDGSWLMVFDTLTCLSPEAARAPRYPEN
jgi:hypothetical protein